MEEKVEITIRPDKKLLTKLWLIFLTLTALVLLTALLLQILIPLEDELTAEDVGRILWPVALSIIFLFWLIGGSIAVLWVKNLKYAIEKDKVVIFKGILTKVQKNIPLRAITDFILHRSLYDRFLGIASIRIQTAGQTQNATGYEGNLAGLMEWNKLLEELREKVKKLHPVSGSLGTEEVSRAQVDEGVLHEILEELKAIRNALKK